MNRVLPFLNDIATHEPRTALEERQALLAHHVRLVAKKMSTSLLVFGNGGLGKTVCITQTLAAENIAPVVVNSHATPLGLYQTLYEHRSNAVLLIEDAEAIFTNLKILGLLRSSTWGDPRIVSYVSSQLNGLPSRFTFSSRIIITANTLPKNSPAFHALLSRMDTFQINATNQEVIEQMRVWAKRGYRGLSREECEEVINFITEEGGSRQLSLRLYEPSLRKREYAQQADVDWKELVRCQLNQIGHNEVVQPDRKAIDMKVMSEAVAKHPFSARDQETFWRQATGRSRASFFRCKREHEGEPS